jgi:hypothetical protein
MAQGTKFLPPMRRVAGQATGQVVCRITLPALSEKVERSFSYGYRDGVRQSKLTKAEAALEGATVVVAARVRKSNGVLGWTQLATWQVGGSIAAFVDSANEGWLQLPKEEGWGATTLVDVAAPVATTRRRRQGSRA